MEIGKTLNAKNKKQWRAWLSKNYKTAKDVWLVFHNKASEKKGIPYDDAVEEALCFGWIDSTVKKLNPDSRVQRFSPRRAKSPYSELNKQRLAKMAAKGKVLKKILSSVQPLLEQEFKHSKDIIAELMADEKAWTYFQAFPDEYQRIRISFIESARKRPDEFRKRLAYFIKMTRQGKMYGSRVRKHSREPAKY